MRYRETGEVHVDFHRSTNGTIAYSARQLRPELLDETFRRMARDVYRAIREDLKRDNPEHLVEHWTYFFDREGGQYTLESQTGRDPLRRPQVPGNRLPGEPRHPG